MGTGETALLGFVAGATILLGLPLGRVRAASTTVRALLNATAAGILLFLLWDVLSQAWQPVDEAVAAARSGDGSWAPVIGYLALFLGGLSVGLLALAAYERTLAAVPQRADGPGAMAADHRWSTLRFWSPARRAALLIAIGIGLHNFAEGLAIGGSAARGEIALATLLVVGFALHNATEGFGIVAPLTADESRPSWGLLGLLGLIGGGPTLLGTLVGHGFTSDVVSVVFLTLAAGSILYVVVQLTGVGLRSPHRQILYGGLLIGMAGGFVTDLVVTAAGA